MRILLQLSFSPLDEGVASTPELQIKEAVLLNVLSFKAPLAGGKSDWYFASGCAHFSLDGVLAVAKHSLSDPFQFICGGSGGLTSMQGLKNTESSCKSHSCLIHEWKKILVSTCKPWTRREVLSPSWHLDLSNQPLLLTSYR